MSDKSDQFLERLNGILKHIKFENYTWGIEGAYHEWRIFGIYEEEDIYTKQVQQQYTRSWLLHSDMTDSDIVQTIFKLCATSMEHRLREHFTYKDARVFGPHFDVEDLVQLCQTRENAGSRKP